MEITCVGKEAHLTGVLHYKGELEFSFDGLLVLLISVDINSLGISESVHDESNVDLLHGLFFINSVFLVVDLSLSGCSELFFNLVEFVLNDQRHGIVAFEDILISVNIGNGLLMLFYKGVELEADEFIQSHIKNSISLGICKKKL